MKSLIALLLLALAALAMDVSNSSAPAPTLQANSGMVALPTECGVLPVFEGWPELKAAVSAILRGGPAAAEPIMFREGAC
jgi:hypothetical protein